MLFTDEAHGCFAKDPAVVKLGKRYYLYYSTTEVRRGAGVSSGMENAQGKFGIGIARSEDLENWTCLGMIPLTQECEQKGIAAPGAIVRDGIVHLFYQTYGNGPRDAICHAWSQDGLHFTKNESNPVFSPTPDWCNGRAIDAEVILFRERIFLYFATRDHAGQIQKLGGAVTGADSDFSRGSWQQITRGSLLAPELLWEGQCIEAPAALAVGSRLFLFYGGSYNCTPQQIGAAVSEDGCFFRRLSAEPFLPCGAPDSWNSSESGHPFVFRDEDGTISLFYQGSADRGQTWYLSRRILNIDAQGFPALTEV